MFGQDPKLLPPLFRLTCKIVEVIGGISLPEDA